MVPYRALFVVFALLCCGTAAAQPLTCVGNMAVAGLDAPLAAHFNRDTPPGELEEERASVHGGAVVQCSNGTPGMPLEVALRVHSSLTSRANPFGPGLLLETAVPGVGIVLQTLEPQMMTSPFQVIHVGTRNSSATQVLDYYTEVRVRFARDPSTPLDLENSFALHGMPLLEMVWRSPGFQDTWQVATTYSLRAQPAGSRNVLMETCFIGPDASSPLDLTENLGTVSAGDFGGVGQEAANRNVAGTVFLRCRNYAGGHLSVESTSAHPTMPGVLSNMLTGADAAEGVGVRIRRGVSGPTWDFLSPWPIAPAVNDIRSFDYYARYVQTLPTIRAGQFKSTVTFTVRYD